MPYVPARTLRLALGCTLLGSALAVMTKAGVDFPTWTIIAIPALVGLLAFRHASFAPARGRDGVKPTRRADSEVEAIVGSLRPVDDPPSGHARSRTDSPSGHRLKPTILRRPFTWLADRLGLVSA